MARGLIDDVLTERVIGCAIEVHKFLGPGLLESVYERCLSHELGLAGIPHQRQVRARLNYKGLELDGGFRMDVVVENRLLIELKSVDHLLPVHEAQTLSYMRLTGLRIGLLLNFKVPALKHGIKRFVM